MFEAAEPIIRNLGGRVVGKEFTTGTETDFAPLVARIAATKAKVLLFALKGDGLNFIPQADDLGLLKDTTIAFLGLSETDLGIFGGKGQNMFVVVPFVAASGMPPVKAFVARIKAEAGADATVSNYVMTHYNALIALQAAIEKAGKLEKELIIDALEGLMIKSPTGPVTIGKNHHATMNMFLAKTKGRDLTLSARSARSRLIQGASDVGVGSLPLMRCLSGFSQIIQVAKRASTHCSRRRPAVRLSWIFEPGRIARRFVRPPPPAAPARADGARADAGSLDDLGCMASCSLKSKTRAADDRRGARRRSKLGREIKLAHRSFGRGGRSAHIAFRTRSAESASSSAVGVGRLRIDW